MSSSEVKNMNENYDTVLGRGFIRLHNGNA